MVDFLTFFAILLIVAAGICMLVWVSLGAMHDHLRRKGTTLGRDDELHRKIDELLRRDV